MKKIFTFFTAILFAGTMMADDVYSVSGNSLAIFYRTWEACHPHGYNKMFLQSDGTYMNLQRMVTLPKGEVKYLIVKNCDFDNGSWPADTAKLVVPKDGVYDVTFTFNPNTKAVDASLKFLRAVTITRPVYLHGSWDADTTYRVPEGDYHDKVVIWLPLEAGDYTFRMTDQNGKSYGDGQEFSRDAASYYGLELGDGAELKLHADVAGDYIFTYEFELEHLFVSYPTKVPDSKIAALNGKFKINSDGDQVHFSRGNLLYNFGEDKWFAAEQQTFTPGDANLRFGDPTYKGTIDMLGWSSADSNFGLRLSNDNSDYSNSEFVDWGGKFADDAREWRTLTSDEWKYVINSRTKDAHKLWTMAGLRQGIDTVIGLLLFPDDWETPAGIEVKYGIYPAADSVPELVSRSFFTEAEWAQLEAAGTVFLPFAGSRTGFWLNRNNGYGDALSKTVNPLMLPKDSMYCWYDELNDMGYYWSSTQAGNDYQVSTLVIPGWIDDRTVSGVFEPGHYLAPTFWTREKRRGQSVRLVTAVKPDVPSAIENTLTTERAVKVLENGQIFIRKGGKVYNVTGQLVKNHGIIY